MKEKMEYVPDAVGLLFRMDEDHQQVAVIVNVLKN